jgi:hypothetical protein
MMGAKDLPYASTNAGDSLPQFERLACTVTVYASMR